MCYPFCIYIYCQFISCSQMASEISSSKQIQNISVTYVSILEILVSSLLICQNHRKYKEHQEFVEFGLFLEQLKCLFCSLCKFILKTLRLFLFYSTIFCHRKKCALCHNSIQYIFLSCPKKHILCNISRLRSHGVEKSHFINKILDPVVSYVCILWHDKRKKEDRQTTRI